MTQRTNVPNKIAEEVLFCSDRTCCICRVKGKSIQIHHIDENNSNHYFDNLAVVCLECHNDIMQKGGFDRKLSPGQVALYRQEWLSNLGRTLTPFQLRLLRMLDETSDCAQSINAISRHLSTSVHHIRRAIDYLVDRGMLSEIRSEHGRPHWLLLEKAQYMKCYEND